jgi:hypothetical protein
VTTVEIAALIFDTVVCLIVVIGWIARRSL